MTGDADTTYPRSTGSPRGEARRQELLAAVTDDLAANGLVDFSLRRAAKVAGTTHKVLLYHFDSGEDLLAQAVRRLRDRRIGRSAAAAAGSVQGSLAERVLALWPVLTSEEGEVLDQAIGLSMYDPARYADLGTGASEQYLPTLLGLCPSEWAEERKLQVAHLILGTLRGLLITRLTSADAGAVTAALAALARALDREEAADW